MNAILRIKKYPSWPAKPYSLSRGLIVKRYMPLSMIIFSLGLCAEQNSYPGRLLVRIDESHPAGDINAIADELGVRRSWRYSIVEGLYLYAFAEDADFNIVRSRFLEHEAVLYVEPDYLYETTSDDPRFSEQWALENNGQLGGNNAADINAEKMWSIERGSSDVVVGVIDTGVDFTHPDLLANIWSNPLEIPGNGIDDDQNGYVDDIHGINAIANNGNPMDDNRHGTHVSGILGASSNNNIGIAGVAPNVKIAACKFLTDKGSGSLSNALKCLEYFANLKKRQNSVNLVATNNSWGGGTYSQAMSDAIRAHEALDILFIVSAGNRGTNIDVTPFYPASYPMNNLVAVASSDNRDRLANSSNFGKKSVHVAAPGVQILSTTLNHSYELLSGTSMAAPHVTGLAALIAAHYGSLDYRGIKNLIMTGGQTLASTEVTTFSGRRIRGADDNGVGSLSCRDQALKHRVTPLENTLALSVGDSLNLSAHHVVCETSGLPLTLADGITLEDNGKNGDAVAYDGIVSLRWTPTSAGTYRLDFGGNDIVSVVVADKPSTPKLVQPQL